MNNIIDFSNEEFGNVRVVMKDGEPWFVAVDVCKALDIANHKDALTRLDEDEKTGVALTDPHGREQVTNVVNEPGLYTLVLGSRKPEAKKFKRWITHEVVPSIRKTGSYSMNQNLTPAEILLQNAQILVDQERRMKAIEDKTDALEDEVKEIKAKSLTVPNEYYTIAGYASIRGISLDVSKARLLGIKASKLCKQYGVAKSKVHDERYGEVGVYHLDILKEVFEGL